MPVRDIIIVGASAGGLQAWTESCVSPRDLAAAVYRNLIFRMSTSNVARPKKRRCSFFDTLVEYLHSDATGDSSTRSQ